MKKKILLLLLIAVAGWQLYTRDPSIRAPMAGVKFGYVVRTTGNAGGDDRLPMLVAMHGDGDSAGHFFDTALNQISVPARVILLKGPMPHGAGDAWPWSPEDIEKYGAGVNEAIGRLTSRYPTSGKPVLLGFSGGGTMAYYQAARHGDEYASVFAISGRLDERQLGGPVVASKATVYGWHGTGDSVVPIGGGKNAVALLQTAGTNARLNEFEGGHLGIFQDVKLQITQAIERELDRAGREW
jgi:predicted esterase